MKARRPNPPIDIPKMQREERRRKPAIDESEFILTTTAGNAAKKRKLNQLNPVLSVKEKEMPAKPTPPKENTRILPVLMVPEIIKLQSTAEEDRGSTENANQDLPVETATQKELLLVPQIFKSNSEDSLKDDNFDHQESRQYENAAVVEIINDISEESSNCFDELAPNDVSQSEESMVQSHPDEEKFSAEFPEDEFLLDSLVIPSPRSHLTTDAYAVKSQPVSVKLTSSGQNETPVFKPKRGRPSKKGQMEALKQEIGSSPQLVTSVFATPLEKPKRGRKKMETYSAPEPVSDPKPLYESIPGKRIRKKIDYRELSGEVDHSSAKTPRQSREVATPTPGNISMFFNSFLTHAFRHLLFLPKDFLRSHCLKFLPSHLI